MAAAARQKRPRPQLLSEQSFWCDGDLLNQNGGVLGRVVCLEEHSLQKK